MWKISIAFLYINNKQEVTTKYEDIKRIKYHQAEHGVLPYNLALRKLKLGDS